MLFVVVCWLFVVCLLYVVCGVRFVVRCVCGLVLFVCRCPLLLRVVNPLVSDVCYVLFVVVCCLLFVV